MSKARLVLPDANKRQTLKTTEAPLRRPLSRVGFPAQSDYWAALSSLSSLQGITTGACPATLSVSQ